MTSTSTFHIVSFAIRGRTPEILLITDKEYDDWCQCEPQEGYEQFLRLHTFDIQGTTRECLAKLAIFAE